MSPEDAAFVKAVVAFVLTAGTVLITWRMWLQTRDRARPALEPIVDALREENAQLRAALEDRMAELENRVDFTERRLFQDRPNTRLPGRTSPTPV